MISGDPKEIGSNRKLKAYIDDLFNAEKPLPETIAAEISREQKGMGGSTRIIMLTDPNSPKTRLALAEKLLPWFSSSSTVNTTLSSYRDLLKMHIKLEGDKRAAMMSEHEFREISSMPMLGPHGPDSRSESSETVLSASFRSNSK
jgi:hypothetical protein